MSKKIAFTKYIAGAAMLLGLGQGVSSCRMDDPNPIDYENFETGIYARIISSNETSGMNLLSINTATYTLTIEAVGKNQAAEMEKYEVFVKLEDRTTSNGTVTRAEKLLKTIPASAFTIDPTSNLPRTTISITGAEVLAALSVSSDSLFGGDSFLFRQALTTTTGKVFTSTNVNIDVTQQVVAGGPGYFRSPFFNRVSLVCPSDLTGNATVGSTKDYVVFTATGTSTDPCCTDPTSTSGKTITLTKRAGVGQYLISDFSGGIYADIWYGPAYGLPANQ